MATNAIEIGRTQRDQLKELGASTGLCLSILIPIQRAEPNNRLAEMRLKSAIQTAEQKLADIGFEKGDIQELLAPVRELEGTPDTWAQAGKSVAIFRSPDLFRWFGLKCELREQVVVADHFYVLPMLSALNENHRFYILALSQKHVRLLRCTEKSSEEVPLPASIPTNLDDFLQFRKPDHTLDNRQVVGQSTGGDFKGVMSTTSTDREKQDEYLYHFFKQVSTGVQELLRDDPAPVVPAAVEYEVGIFRRGNVLQHVSEHAVFGAPDGLKGGELHARALEAVAPEWDAPLNRALELYERQGGSERTSADARQIVKAAFEGRVAHLFIAAGASLSGNFDEAANRVHISRKVRPGDEDLVNAAALRTLSNSGEVFVIPRERVPGQADMAAVLRY